MGGAYRGAYPAGMATVEVTNHLYEFFPQLKGSTLSIDATTVGEVVRALDRLAPGFAFYVCDEAGRLRQHVNVFVEEKRIRDRATLTDAVGPTSRVFILQALSGG
jgi:sulfur-carrier protein